MILAIYLIWILFGGYSLCYESDYRVNYPFVLWLCCIPLFPWIGAWFA